MSDAALVKMINTALAALGQEPVSDLEEGTLQGSLAATKLLRHIDDARDTVLARHGWLCALEYATLSPASLPDYVNWRYPVAYLLPGNSLRVWEIGGVTYSAEGCWAPSWEVGSVDDGEAAARTIIRAANVAARLNVAYVRRANWAALTVHVRDAIAFEVAARGAKAVTGDEATISRAKKEAETRVLLAISVDGTQEGGQAALAPSIPAMIRAGAR